MMLRMEMYLDLSYSLARAWAETMMFLGCSSRRMTSSTVVLRTSAAVRVRLLPFDRQRRVPGHQEVAARRGDERGYQPHQVVVHVA